MSLRLLLGLPLLPALVSAASSASSSVVDLILPGFDDQTILASVISVEPTATQYFITCPTDEDSTECGLGPGMTLVEGPSTYELHMTIDTFTADASCAIASNTAVCTSESAGADADESSVHAGATQSVETLTDLSSYMIPVTITAGLEKLSGGGSPAPTTASQTSVRPTASVGSASITQSARSTAVDTAAAASSSAAGTASHSTGAAPHVTQNALLAGAAAAIFGGAMMI